MNIVRKVALAGALMLLLCGVAPAFADSYVGDTPPNAGSVEVGAPTGGVQAASVNSGGGLSASSSGLAFTGADVVGLLSIALIAVGAGVVFVRLGRRPTGA